MSSFKTVPVNYKYMSTGKDDGRLHNYVLTI